MAKLVEFVLQNDSFEFNNNLGHISLTLLLGLSFFIGLYLYE